MQDFSLPSVYIDRNINNKYRNENNDTLENCLPFLACHRDDGYHHLFERDAAVLEGVAVVADVVVVVVGIGKEGVARGEDIARREVGRRQLGFLRFAYDEEVAVVEAQVLA